MNASVKKYIDLNKEKLVSIEGLNIFLMELGKTFQEAQDISKGYKGLINTYAIAFLKRVSGEGGRHSGTYIQLLKEYLNNDDQSSSDDKVIINFDLVNDSENKL